MTFKMNKNKFTQLAIYWLRKIKTLEKIKYHYLINSNLKPYKKACQLQEKIIICFNKKNTIKSKNHLEKTIAKEIQQQADINEILLNDVKKITVDYFNNWLSSYYNEKGNLKKNQTNLLSINA